jgi:hypothetical protein
MNLVAVEILSQNSNARGGQFRVSKAVSSPMARGIKLKFIKKPLSGRMINLLCLSYVLVRLSNRLVA